jgi:hypothetical protein
MVLADTRLCGAKKTDGGLKNSAMKPARIMAALGLQIFEVCQTERASQAVQMKLDVRHPLRIQCAKDKSAERAALGTTGALVFPDFRQ